MSSLNIRTHDPNQARVFDIADPDRHGVIIKAGAEVSEVRFLDDGAVRNIINDQLRAVETVDTTKPADGLSQHNPSSPVSEAVRLGQEAMARKRRSWDDWLLIAEALEAGRAEVMRALHTNEVSGRRFEKAMGEWLIANGFKEIDKGTRSRALDCLKHKAEIQAWRAQLTDSERWKFNHPDTVLRKWKASIEVPDPNAPPKVSPMQKLKDELVGVIEERDRFKHEVELGGGSLWTAEDKVEHITPFIIRDFGKSKAERLARHILKVLKEAKAAKAGAAS